MNNKRGFTLVELMVVIVIIGILAAVAIPRLMAAANRARASEGPQMLGTIARMQHAYRVETNQFIVNLAARAPVPGETPNEDGTGGSAAVRGDIEGWQRLGFDGLPASRFFNFVVVENPTNISGHPDVTGSTFSDGSSFMASANATDALLTTPTPTDHAYVTNEDVRGAGGRVAPLVGGWTN